MDAKEGKSFESVGWNKGDVKVLWKFVKKAKKGFTVAGLIVLALLFESSTRAEYLEFSSGSRRVQLVELYTSQGCSSCPAAEVKLNKLSADERLWSEFVPVAYHVDYWDRLGWRDPFASEQFTQRQYQHRAEGNLQSVYTPAFVIDGEEWRGYFKGLDWPTTRGDAGVLVCRIRDGRLSATFESGDANWRLNVAVLGMGLNTRVSRGENRNRSLDQDFVVVWQASGAVGEVFDLPAASDLAKAERYAVAVWTSGTNSLRPLQTTGGWWSPR